MKFLALTAFLAMTSAHASYYATHCSNPSASVKWETGHNSNTMTIRYYSNVAAEKKVDFYKLDVKIEKLHMIKEESKCEGNMASRMNVYAAKATITPSAEHPSILDFTGEAPLIEEFVICEYNMNSRASCQ